jgi:G:T/U-mismatch repair DNA glycosylase
VVPSDLSRILDKCNIKQIYANGNTAKKLYEKYTKEKTGMEIIGLPSTSPANAAYSLERLVDCWSTQINTHINK